MGKLIISNLFSCPKCYKGKLFTSFLLFASECSKCGLNYSKTHIGDGAIYIVLFFTCIFSTILAIVFDYKFELNIFVNLGLSLLILTITSLFLLKIAKAIIFRLEYYHSRKK
jgi:uncharacterized protein (DUF983 family)